MTAAERLQAEKERLLATTGFYVPPYRMANLMKAAAKIMDSSHYSTHFQCPRSIALRNPVFTFDGSLHYNKKEKIATGREDTNGLAILC